MSKNLYNNPDVSKVIGMYEEYRQFINTATNDLKDLAAHYESLNKGFVERYQKNMKEYLKKVQSSNG